MPRRDVHGIDNAWQELRIHLCQTSAESAGTRDFLKKQYALLKSANPLLPVLVREASGVKPMLYARYLGGAERSVSLHGLGAADVRKQIEELSKPE